MLRVENIATIYPVGLRSYQPERLSRVNFTFDYHLPVIDFDEDNVVSSFAKDNTARTARCRPFASVKAPFACVSMTSRMRRRKNSSNLAKSYLNILVDEIVVQDKTATISRGYAALAKTMQKIKMGNLKQVPTFMLDWRPAP